MRRILVENARRKQRLKHGGGQQRVELDTLDVAITTTATTDEQARVLLTELGLPFATEARRD